MTIETLMRRRAARFCIAACLAGGVAFWFWPRPGPHVLLITLDTTRADRLGCYGYSIGRTPVLDSLAAAGVVFERAQTVAPLTLPAHASLFTGLYPAESRICSNGRGRLDDSIPTLAEILRKHGYESGAFVASFVLNRKFGLDRGFKTYDDDFASDELAPDALHRQRHGASVVDGALAWLEIKRSRPFFCWVHLYDPHAPYLAHSDLFGDEFAGRPYDAEIAYVDQQVGRLVDFLKARGLESQTLVVVVGDHGEGLGDHVELRHSMTLYNEIMRVPLIFRLPGKLAAGRRVASNASLVDLSPTILDLAGIADPRKISGQSTKRALLGGDAKSMPCYGATDEPFLVNGCEPLRSLTEANWKYIRTTRPELYDLARDPHERMNLAETRPDKLHEMQSQLAAFESRLAPRAEVEVKLSPAERRALASLGYVGGTRRVPAGGAPTNLPDVKDMLPYDVAVEQTVALIANGSVDAAIEKLQTIVRDAPGNLSAYWTLAGAFQKISKLADAEEVLRALLATRAESREGHYALGLVLLDLGRSDEAASEFTKVLAADPGFAEAHFYLGKISMIADQADSALRHFDAAIERDPQYAEAYHWRANLLAQAGQLELAIADYRQALKYDPDNPDVHHNLGRVLAGQGDVNEARKHLARAVELNPDSAELHYALGAFLVRERQFDDAIEHLTRALQLEPGHTAAEKQLHHARQALRRHP